MQKRNATVAVIGAGDYIGGEIAKKFAAEGFTVFAGRRDGAKLEPLVKEIEAAGGSIVARSLDARKEDEISAFLTAADQIAPLEVCIFNVGANVHFPLIETTERVFRKVWEMACYSGFLAVRESARLMLPRGRGAIFVRTCANWLRHVARPLQFSPVHKLRHDHPGDAAFRRGPWVECARRAAVAMRVLPEAFRLDSAL